MMEPARVLKRPALPSSHSLALATVMLIAVLVRAQILFGAPYAPGADYGHTLLFAEETRRLGEVPRVFPFHQLGATSFRSSPGLPLEMLALGSATDLPPLRLPGFALVFSVVGVMGIYLLGKIIAGPGLGLAAALIYAVLPANLEILGWAGYANIYALALTPFLWWAIAAARQRFSHRRVWLAALLASAIALVHLLTALFVGAATLLAAALDLAVSKGRSRPLKVYGYLLAATVLLSLPTLAQVIRAASLWRGGSLSSWSLEMLAPTRPSLEDYLHFFSALGIALAAVGLARLAARTLKPSLALGLAVSLLFVSAAVAYSWTLGIAFYYERALYFAAIPLSLCVGYALWSTRWPMGRLGLAAGVAGAMSLGAVQSAPRIADYYSLLNADSLAAMEWVEERTSPGDAVVTDGCLAFLWEYIGKRPTAAAFNPIYLSSGEEEAIAADARRILQGHPAASRLLKAYQVRYLVYDSGCPTLNSNVVLEHLRHQPGLKRAATFGRVYVYQAEE